MSSSTKRMKPTILSTSVDDLPPEMISKLFEYLPPKDLAACSLVNKRWHSIYSNFKLHSLVVTDYHPDCDPLRWHDSNRTILEAERCLLAMFHRLVEKPLLSNLKHLAICLYEPEFKLNKLNRFQQLVHLEIHSFRSIEEKVHLNLPKLKVLRFHRWCDDNHLTLDCPELRSLAYLGEHNHHSNRLDVKHPETIRKLVTSLLSPQLDPFKGVECLVTRKFEAISNATLLSLPKLKELRYDQSVEDFFWSDFGEDNTVDDMKQTLREFVEEARKLRGRDFRFTFSGFELTNVDVEQIDFGVEVDEESGHETACNEYVYMKNYRLVEPGALPFLDKIDYNLMLSNLTEEFPRCFFEKFTDIQLVYARAEVKNVDHFLWFLKSLKSLRDLFLEKTWFSQAFYDQLPASASSLRSLTLIGGYCEHGLQLNFDFIGKLLCLLELKIYSNLSLKSLPSFVGWLGRLKEGKFSVRLREKEFWINKRRYSTEWKIERASSLLLKTENPEEIVHFFDDLHKTSEIGTASD